MWKKKLTLKSIIRKKQTYLHLYCNGADIHTKLIEMARSDNAKRCKKPLQKQPPKKKKTDQDYRKGGITYSLHRNIYQLKLLMLFLY